MGFTPGHGFFVYVPPRRGFLPLGQYGRRVLSSPPPSVCLSVCLSAHPCERDNSSRNITIAFKLHTDVHGVKISHKFDLDLSATFVTLPIGSRPTLLVNAITPQEISQSLSNFTEVFLRSKSWLNLMLAFMCPL